MATNLELLKLFVEGRLPAGEKMPFTFPPPIARTLGFELVAVDDAHATIAMTTAMDKHANPMGTLHGGVLCDMADAAIGTAHSTTLAAGETFTSVDLKINFFRPVWNAKLKASAQPIHRGKTISYYTCAVTDDQDRLVATVTSTVMTLRGDAAKGR